MGRNQSTKLSIRRLLSPTLVAGAVTITFLEFTRVLHCLVFFDGAQIGDYTVNVNTAIATNVVTLTFNKIQFDAANTWGNAVTADLNLKVITVLAEGI